MLVAYLGVLAAFALAGCRAERERVAPRPAPTEMQAPATVPAARDPQPALGGLPRLERAWRGTQRPMQHVGSLPVVASSDTVYVAQENRISAHELASGALRWEVELAATREFALSLAGTRLFAASQDGVIGAWDTATGRQLWTTIIDCEIGLDPVAYKNSAVLGCRGRDRHFHLIALDLASGATRWHVPFWQPLVALALDGTRCYSVESRRPTTIEARKLGDGELAWSTDLEQSISSLGLAAGVLLADDVDATVALAPATGARRWRLSHGDGSRPFLARDNSPRTHAGRLVLLMDAAVLGVDPKTGLVEQRWAFEREDDGWLNVELFASQMQLLLRTTPDSLLVWSAGAEQPRVVAAPGSQLLLAGDTLLVTAPQLEAYSIARPTTPESALPGAERVTRALQRWQRLPPELGEIATIPDLVQLLRAIVADGSSELRREAVHALGLLEDAGSVPALIAILDEPLPPTPRAACAEQDTRELGIARARSSACREEIEARKAAETLRTAVAQALSRTDSRAAGERLVALLDDGTKLAPEQRQSIRSQLARSGLEQQLRTLDRARQPSAAGWRKLCDASPMPDSLSSVCGADSLSGTRDADADGVPEEIEARLGTDPRSRDTDRDGAPDGSDPNPLAARAKQRPQTAELVTEIARHVLFAEREPALIACVYLPKPYRSEVTHVAALVVHRDPLAPERRMLPYSRDCGSRHVIIDELSIDGARATARVRHAVRGSHAYAVLDGDPWQLRQADGAWRVTQSPGPRRR